MQVQAQQIQRLNSLRGIAAMIVVVSHFSNSTNLFNGVLGHGSGQLGVMIFFILSGFLMSFLYLHKDVQIKKYLSARLARVGPLFLVVVLFSFLIQQFRPNGVIYEIHAVSDLFSHLLLMSGVSVLWTIPTEIQFYLLFIPLWWLFSINKTALYFVLAVVIIAVWYAEFPNPTIFFGDLKFQGYIFRSLPYFLVGLVFGQLFKAWHTPEQMKSGYYSLSLLLVLLLYPDIYAAAFGEKHEMWNDLIVLLTLSVMMFMIIFLVPDRSVVLNNVAGEFLGKISYSLYLIHVPILHLVVKLDSLSIFVKLAVFIGVSLFVSWVSFMLIENPSRKFLRKVLK
jgi:peptidoglycan/LPS O-acetylase OafA/YrhL